MKALLHLAAITALSLTTTALTTTAANAVVLGFDDITSGFTFTNVPTNYAGLSWQNFGVANKAIYKGTGYEHGAVSGAYTAYNGSGYASTISALEDTFSFDGAWFTSAWLETNTLTIEGFVDDDDIADYTFSVVLSKTSPLFVDVSWSGLQRLRFSSNNNPFAMDNLRINEVPEPLTLGLVGMGLLGIAGARRRKS